MRRLGITLLVAAILLSGCGAPSEGSVPTRAADQANPATRSVADEYILHPHRANASAILFTVSNLPTGGLGKPTFGLHREIAESSPGDYGALLVFELASGIAELLVAQPFDGVGHIGQWSGPVGNASTSVLVVVLSNTPTERTVRLRPQGTVLEDRVVADGLESHMALYGNISGFHEKETSYRIRETDAREDVAGLRRGKLSIQSEARPSAGDWLTLACARTDPAGLTLSRMTVRHAAGDEQFEGKTAGGAGAGAATWVYFFAELSSPIGASFEIDGVDMTEESIAFVSLHVAEPSGGWPFAFEREDSRDQLAEPEVAPGC